MAHEAVCWHGATPTANSGAGPSSWISSSLARGSRDVIIPDRRQFLRAAALAVAGAALPLPALALGDEERFTIATLDLGAGSPGRTDPRGSAVRRLLLEVEKRTSVAVAPRGAMVSLTGPDLFDHPFALFTGEGSFDPLPDKAIKRLGTYLQNGGFLFVDSAEGLRDGPFLTSVRRELARIYPADKLGAIPRDHVLYKSFYLVPEATGRVEASPTMEAIFAEDRLPVVLSANDLLGALARDSFGNWEYEVSPGGQQQREMAFRLGINLVMYALCLNYKADQVHIPFILKRRKWKVDD